MAARALPPTLAWVGDVAGQLALLDQTRLPQQVVVVTIDTLDGVIDAIVRLVVRGAPAIGVAAGYGMLLGVRAHAPRTPAQFLAAADRIGAALIGSRPTAVNLAWAVRRVRGRAQREPTLSALLAEARAIHLQDEAQCRGIGEAGAGLIEDGMTSPGIAITNGKLNRSPRNTSAKMAT